ncbi:MAG: hypothetical protein ABI367_05300 [Mucilaginibacter sp.]
MKSISKLIVAAAFVAGINLTVQASSFTPNAVSDTGKMSKKKMDKMSKDKMSTGKMDKKMDSKMSKDKMSTGKMDKKMDSKMSDSKM